ncbi:MAG: biotin/lipoyl-containing protein, partial [Solirubrobacterales bacterium]
MPDVVMPRLSDSMEEGTILQWLKQVGDEIAVGDQLVEIETDKANMAYESDVAGTLTEILAQEGETLPIGAPIARVGDSETGTKRSAAGSGTEPGGPAGGRTASVLGPPGSTPEPAEGTRSRHAEGPSGQVSPPAGSAGTGAEDAAGSAAGQAERAGTGDGQRAKASPVAKRMAKERGLDLSTLRGSGPGGRIIKADVERAASSAGGVEEGGPRTDAVRPPAGP